MKIGVIGIGAIGGELAKKLVIAGHEVKVCNSTQGEKLQTFATSINATPATLEEVVQNVDVVIISLAPAGMMAIRDTVEAIPSTIVVLDTFNYYPGRDDPVTEIDDNTMIHSEWAQSLFKRPVVKAFNSILASTLVDRAFETPRIGLAVFGDLKEHRDVALTIADAVGFEGVDAGTIADSYKGQPGSLAYCREMNAVDTAAAVAAQENDIVTIKKKADYIWDESMKLFTAGTFSDAAIRAIPQRVHSQQF